MLFQYILNMSFSASFLIMVVFLLRIILKRAPRQIVCLLWGLVALRLVCPFSIESATSLLPSAEPIPRGFETMTSPQIESGIDFIDHSVNPVIEKPLGLNTFESTNRLQIWLTAGGIIWIIGVLILFAYAGISYLLLYRKVRVSVPAGDKIYLCDDIASPFILGIIRPRIYMPSGMKDEVSRYVIAHERAHLKRLDHFWKPFGYVLLAVYWFNPLMWVAYVLLCRDIETACDECVVRDMELEDKKAYSRALVSCSVSRKMIAACPLAFGEAGVKSRVKSVLNYRKPSFWVILLAAVALIGVVVFFMTNPISEKEISDNPQESVEESAQKTINENSENTEAELDKDEADQVQTAELNKLLTAKYVDINQLEPREGIGNEELVYEDRLFVCEDNVQNELEHLGYLNYQLDSAGDYDSKYEIWMENETSLISIRNEKKAFEEGLYMSEYRIHELETLSLEAVLNASDSTKEYVLSQQEKFNLSELAVVKVDVSWEHNPRSLDRHPQFGNGRYIRYYVVGRSQEDSGFKLCEVFWEDGYYIDMQKESEEPPTLEEVMERIEEAIPLKEATPLTTTADLPAGDQLYFLDATADGKYSLYGFRSDEYYYTGLLINYKLNGRDYRNYITDIEHWIGYEFPCIAEAPDGGLFMTYCFGGGTGTHVDRFFYFKANEDGSLKRYELTTDSVMEQAEELVSFNMDTDNKVVKIFDREDGKKEHFASVPYEDALNGQEYNIKGIYCDSCQVKFMLEPNMLILGYGFFVEESVMPVHIGELAFQIGVEYKRDEVGLVLSDVSTYERGVIEPLPAKKTAGISSADEAVELVREQVIKAYENVYGPYVPTDAEPTLYSDDSERLAYIIPRLEVIGETDEYYVIPVIWDFRVYKSTGEVKVYYNGIDPYEYTFDPTNPNHIAFAG
ncbi:MAG: hypothetical protein E7292_01095 [Lachnospiraceae bacterium]|nr:hypothetical protein [Lachnospiraceae bacterium]